jgi:hypothetical protein
MDKINIHGFSFEVDEGCGHSDSVTVRLRAHRGKKDTPVRVSLNINEYSVHSLVGCLTKYTARRASYLRRHADHMEKQHETCAKLERHQEED